jgi:hypothetical protein
LAAGVLLSKPQKWAGADANRPSSQELLQWILKKLGGALSFIKKIEIYSLRVTKDIIQNS